MRVMENIKCIRTLADPVQIGKCRDKIRAHEPGFGVLARMLSLAANEVRLKILYLLKEENQLCPCDIADMLYMTVPAISQHLRKLKDGGIIKSRKAGNTIYYSIEPEYLTFLEPFFKYIIQSVEKYEVI